MFIHKNKIYTKLCSTNLEYHGDVVGRRSGWRLSQSQKQYHDDDEQIVTVTGPLVENHHSLRGAKISLFKVTAIDDLNMNNVNNNNNKSLVK